ncbi:MAG: hypothetical protein GX591_12725 [Planctomycetes bacterium]|nr:hypothetical protein [Planctomycetota bacterium]
MKLALLVCLVCAVSGLTASAFAADAPDAGPYVRWSRGPSTDPSFFPLAVWAQSPANAEQYRAAGVNVYVSLHRGPTEAQIAQLKAAGMKVVCHLNDYARANIEDPVFIAWMHGDEPDNARQSESVWNRDAEKIRQHWPEYSLEEARRIAEGMWGPGYGPAQIYAGYEQLKRDDPSRPVLLNLGQSVAYTDWGGRGPRTRHTEDYPRYTRACDIVSFDIYPANHSVAKYRGQLWYVPFGVSRLNTWGQGEKIVWNCVEVSPINLDDNRSHIPTGREVRNEVWSAIIHGSRGIIYFCHQFQPQFNDHFVLTHDELREPFTKLNHQVQSLAPVINAPVIENLATVWYADPDVPVKATFRSRDGYVYIFAAAMREGRTKARFTVYGIGENAEVEVIDEGRTITCTGRTFEDDFADWDVHLYRIKADGHEGFAQP